MPDGLDAAIRAKLDGWLDDICGAWSNGCAVEDHDRAIRMRAAIVAVLDRHKPQRLDDEHDPYCAECSGLHAVPVTYPCRTIRDIATELGIEADDD